MKKEFRAIQFRNRMTELLFWDKQAALFRKNDHPYVIGEVYGNIFRLREFFYNHYDFNF